MMAVLLCAGATLPLAPTLAQSEDQPKREERREIVVRQSDTPTAGGADNVSESVITFSPDSGVTISADVAVNSNVDEPVRQRMLDARTGQVIEVRGNDIRIVSGTELDQARAEVERARANLQVAEKRLKDLERKQGAGAKVDGKMEWEMADKMKSAKMKAENADDWKKMKGAKVDTKAWQSDKSNYTPAPEKRQNDSGDAERRIDKLEQKLDKIDAMLKELRDMKEKDRREKNNGDKGPATSNLGLRE